MVEILLCFFIQIDQNAREDFNLTSDVEFNGVKSLALGRVHGKWDDLKKTREKGRYSAHRHINIMMPRMYGFDGFWHSLQFYIPLV